MQLDPFYISIIQISLIDAIAIGASSGWLAATIFGIKLKRGNSGSSMWLIGGTAGVVFGTFIGYLTMNLIGSVLIWSGTPIQGLTGPDLSDWSATIITTFSPYHMQTIGFSIIGALFGVGWGYAIGARPDDTSIFGNLVATLGAISVFCGMLFIVLQSFILLSDFVAIVYLSMFSGLIIIGYALAAVVNIRREDSQVATTEELVV